VQFNGDDHQVVGLNGTAVRLRSSAGTEQVLLSGCLMAAPEFHVVGGDQLPEDVLEPLRPMGPRVVLTTRP
jgi:putative transposase